MDYRVASNIRGKSLSSLMTDNLTSGKGIGSSLSGAISSKFKARATGIKEKFDPMNIAKFMTGGSRLAPAILGKLTGRSQSDINYFAGDKNKRSGYTQMPSSMSTPGEGLGGSAVEVLNRMLAFMQSSREEDMKRKDTAKQFTEEQKVEEQRRHNEFLKVLQEYTSLGSTTTLVSKKEEGGDFLSGLMDTIKSMIANAVAGVTASFNAALKAYEWIKDLQLLTRLAPYASGLVTFLGSTFGALFLTALTPAALLLYLAKGEKEEIEKDPFNEKYKDNPYAMKLRGEAETIGQATVINQGKATRQFKRQEIVEFVKSNYTDSELVDNVNYPGMPGADRPTLQKWLDANPKPGSMFQGSVSAIAGQPETAIPAGGKPLVRPTTATPLPEGVTPSTAGAGRGSAESSANDSRRLDIPQTTTPVPEAPVSTRMNNAVDENQNLNLESYDSGSSGSVAPVISSSSSSVDLPDRPIPATATVRDTTPILTHVMQGYLAPV